MPPSTSLLFQSLKVFAHHILIANLLIGPVMYLRFVRPNRIGSMNAREGIFRAAYELRYSENLDDHTSNQLEQILDWFRIYLVIPDRFHRSKSKAARYRNTKGLSWFKGGKNESLDKAFELSSLLNEVGYSIETIKSKRIGYIVYEDDFQVVAEPFSDTRK